MARATKWTDEKIKAQKLPEGVRERRVLVEPGLYLFMRARADGGLSKQWQYRAQVDGSRRWLSLGSYPEVTLADAGDDRRVHDKVHQAAKKGDADHPVIVARQSRKAKKAQPTVDEAFEEMLADKRMGSARKGGAPVRERTIDVLRENYNADIKSEIGDSKIAMVTRESVQKCIDAPRKRGAPGAAAHVYRTLRSIISFAIKRGHIVGADPMRGIDNPRPYRPAPVVAASDAELVSLLRGLDDSKLWESTKLAIEFQLLTGARPSEIRLSTWSEMKLDRSVWVIPAERFKTNREHRIHLSKESLALLERAKALRGQKVMKGDKGREVPDFVFPGSEGAAMDKMAVARALRRMAARTEEQGGKKLRPHDLRRTLRTVMSRIGVAPHVAELCLGHVEKETMRRVYDGHDYSGEMADAWDRAGAHIAALRRGGAQVIALQSRAA